MLKRQGERTLPCHNGNLAPYEIQLFIDWVMYRWTAQERCAFAAEFPELYNRIVGSRAFKTVREDGL